MLSCSKCNTSPLGGQKWDIPLRQSTDASFVWTSNRMLGTMCSYTPCLCHAGSAACSGGTYGRQWMEVCCRKLEMKELPCRCATVLPGCQREASSVSRGWAQSSFPAAQLSFTYCWRGEQHGCLEEQENSEWAEPSFAPPLWPYTSLICADFSFNNVI